MKKIALRPALFGVSALVATTLATLFFAVPAAVAATESSDGASEVRDAEPVPAPGEYAVLISEKTAARDDWRAAAEKFVGRYAGTLVIWRGNDISSAREALKKLRPRYVAVVAAPEEIDRVFVAKLHRLSREMNDDVYGDFLWGIVSGADGDVAASQLAPAEPLVLERAIGTTNFERARFKRAFFITDWAARQFVETRDYESSPKTSAEPSVAMEELFAERWAEIRPQFVITSSHATEFNLEMPFGEGLIASAGTDFFLVEKNRMREFAKVLPDEAARQNFLRDGGFKTLPRSGNPKIWLAAGNCLFGDTLRTPNSMAQTAISAAGVKQLVGYTVPSWFGEIGWKTNEIFFGGHQATSFAQAWFFANQTLLDALPRKLSAIEIPLVATGMEGLDAAALLPLLAAQKNAGKPLSRENFGRLYDRDTVAFYGDPLFRVRFDEAAPNRAPWRCTVSETAAGTQIFSISSTSGNAQKGDFCLWFPKRFDTQKKFSAKRIFPKRTLEDLTKNTPRRARPKAPKPSILTENFVVFRALDLSAGETLELRVPVEKRAGAAEKSGVLASGDGDEIPGVHDENSGEPASGVPDEIPGEPANGVPDEA